MILKRKLGPKGQIVIPKDIRDMLNLKPGSEIIFEIHENKITIRPVKNGEDFLKNFIKTPKKLKEPIDYMEVFDQQYRSK